MFKKIRLNYVLVIIGALIMLFGIYLVFQQTLCDRDMTPYAGLILGSGAGLSAVGLSNIYYMKNPKFAKMKSIEENDERNKFIRYKTGSQVNRITSAAVVILAVVVGRADVPNWVNFALGGIVLLDAVSYILLFYKNKKSN